MTSATLASYESWDSELDEIDGDIPKKKMTVKVPVKKGGKISKEEYEEEQKKIVEGADALLNLAGIKTTSSSPLRSISPVTNTDSGKSSASSSPAKRKSGRRK